MAGYIITTILLVIVLFVQGFKQNFLFWKFIIVMSLGYVMAYDISWLLDFYMEDYMFIIWTASIILCCLGVIVLLTGDEKESVAIINDSELKM